MEELPPGQRKIVEVNGLSIGVFNVKGSFFALYNRCPHKAAPLCLGVITDGVNGPARGEYEIVREGEIVRCPWHGWEFDIMSGRSWFNPHKLRVRTYDVAVERELANLPERVDTFPVEVENEVVVLYLSQRRASESS